ncbi:MAG: hypothetical protein HY308_18590 [Gammaproteobacteria bacterium]|nr:hypothetical protein [Gammaproteobacteria bacterium]
MHNKLIADVKCPRAQREGWSKGVVELPARFSTGEKAQRRTRLRRGRSTQVRCAQRAGFKGVTRTARPTAR